MIYTILINQLFNRYKFFCSIINFPPKEGLPHQYYPTFKIEKVEKKIAKKTVQENHTAISVLVETKYRESSAQTHPWQPPYTVIGEGDPELLKLDFLKWTCGLPAGMQEIRLIERSRMRAAWEKAIEPQIDDEQSLVRFRDYLEALERDEWTFREKEINEIQELRLQLLENMLNEIHEMSKTRTEMKMKHFIEKKEAEKEFLLQKIRKKTTRELRKLDSRLMGLNTKYKEENIIDEHIDKKSEIYGPLMRHGEHPKRWHQVIDEKLKTYKAQFLGVERFSTLPRWLDRATKINRNEIYANSKGTRMCIKETKWTAPVLKQLHEVMKNLRKEMIKQPLTLRTKVEHAEKVCHTPEVDAVPEMEEKRFQAALMLQKLIRGRATQMMIYEGRDTCKELIQELKYSVGLLKKQKEFRTRHRLTVKSQQREECMQMKMVQKLQGTLGKLQGSVIGTLLDFLNKELRRLLEERKVHAMCLLNERERYIREAAESGRRQKELRRRREHDEMFKQIVKVTQESVDIYLQDVITEGMEFASTEEATAYITSLAKRIEYETDQIYKEVSNESSNENDEFIANMVLHFLVPDVEKKIIKARVHSRQQENLSKIHEVIQTEFEELPNKFKVKSEDQEKSITIEDDILIKEFMADDSTQSEIDETEITEQSYISIDPVEEYLRELEKEQEYREDPFSLVRERQDYEERVSPPINASLDTIPEVSE